METAEKPVKNFLYTKGYVCKRLRENGFECKVLPLRYSAQDARYWSIVVSVKEEDQNLIMTCMKSGIKDKRGVYNVSGSKFSSFKIDTKSMEVLIESLNNLCHPEEINHETV